MTELAISDYPWMGTERHEGATMRELQSRWPNLKFMHFCMNGADDVVKYRKYMDASERSRYITMGRPGSTDMVEEGMKAVSMDPDAGYMVLGPELPDISSTAVREALGRKDVE